jgi:hypothetical protein
VIKQVGALAVTDFGTLHCEPRTFKVSKTFIRTTEVALQGADGATMAHNKDFARSDLCSEVYQCRMGAYGYFGFGFSFRRSAAIFYPAGPLSFNLVSRETLPRPDKSFAQTIVNMNWTYADQFAYDRGSYGCAL